ncbi:hypothetical protein Ndes2437B_g01485 [Nannochloris sp. 'desiccata']
MSLFKTILVLAALSALAKGASVPMDTCAYYIPSPSFVCNGNAAEAQALEIQDVLTSMISASSGDNPMTYDEFITYPSQVGIYSLNTPRNLQFSSNCFFKSPNAPMDCSNSDDSSAECITINTIKSLNNTTWGELALNACASYYPSNSTDVVLGPAPAGQVLVAPINKCQNMTFTETNAWILTDEWKNTYIMHASGANTTEGVDAAAAAAVFPPGWAVAKVPLNGAFTISPRMTSGGECFYTIIRDSQDNSYHQYGCGGGTFPTDFNPACPAATKSGYVPGSTPSPPPSSPPPPAPKRCSYDGAYNIRPALLNCAGQYVAWPSPSNCNNTAVGIKTQNQLGGKPVRASWTIKGEGRKPLNIVAAKDCVANQMDISTDGIVLGSVKFPWEIQPIGTSCDSVNIVAPSRKGAKYLGMRVSTIPGNCSKKFTFTSTPGPQNVFKLVRAS